MVIHVVTGPPCSGKSSYVQQYAGGDDVVIDMDRIAQAMCGAADYEYPQHVRDVARAARMAAITAAVAATDQPFTVWIIDTWPNPARWAKWGARITTLDPGQDVCIERARRERPEWVVGIIHEWYGKSPTSRKW